MSTKIERIKLIMDDLGLSATAFAKHIGFNQSNLSKIIRGEREVPSNLIEKILDHTEVKRTWLLTGEGEMLSHSEATPLRHAAMNEYTTTKNGTKFYEREDGQITMKIPIVPIAALGSPEDEFAELITDYENDTVTIVVDGVHHGRYTAFRVEGDSMDDGTYNGFRKGDIVAVRELARDKWLPKLHFSKWPFWVVVFGNNIRIKEIIAQDETTGDITLHSLNPSPEYTDFTLHLDDIQRLFNIVQHIPKPRTF